MIMTLTGSTSNRLEGNVNSPMEHRWRHGSRLVQTYHMSHVDTVLYLHRCFALLKGNQFFFRLDIFGFYSMQRFIHVDKSVQVRWPGPRPRLLGEGIRDLLFIFFFITALSRGLGALSLDTTSAATTIGRSQSEIDVLLGVLRNVGNTLDLMFREIFFFCSSDNS
jgi:hypothetical protein